MIKLERRVSGRCWGYRCATIIENDIKSINNELEIGGKQPTTEEEIKAIINGEKPDRDFILDMIEDIFRDHYYEEIDGQDIDCYDLLEVVE